MAFSSVGVADPARPPGLLSLSVMVEVEGDREKVLVRGPRWVSFNSARHHMSAGIPTPKRRSMQGLTRRSRCGAR